MMILEHEVINNNFFKDFKDILKSNSKINNLLEIKNFDYKYFYSILENFKLISKSLNKISSITSYNSSNRLVKFNDNKKIILKNSNSDLEDIYNLVLLWVNNNSKKDTRLYIPKVIKDNKNTIKEFISYKPCENENQEKSFYLKSGKILEVLYILNITGIKKENIIANGEDPVILNFNIESNIKASDSFFCDEIANTIIKNSVCNIEFLSNNRPGLNDYYIDCIKCGFQEVYTLILENKSDLIKFLNKNTKDKEHILAPIISNIQMLNIEDLKRQLSFISAKFSKKYPYKNNISFSNNESNVELDRENLLEVACNIGDYLIEKGIIGFNDSGIERTWIDILESGKISTIGNNLYEGNNGIALFLAYLGAISNKNYFIDAALESMKTVIRYLETINEDSNLSLSTFKGISGIFYTLSKLYKLTGDKSIKKCIKEKISILYKLIDYKCINAMDGSAGVIAVLTCIYNDIDDKSLKETIYNLLDIAYKNIVDQVNSLKDSDIYNIGFAYGLSGVVAYLSKLISIKNENHIKETIKNILTIERKLYEKEKNNLSSSWLNGCSGLLLSRLMLKSIDFPDEFIDDEINDIIDLNIKNWRYDNPYYAYGQIGTLEVLNYAAKTLKNDKLKNRCIDTYNKIIESTLNGTMYKNNDYYMEPISFITGLTGIGYSLIQKYNEDLVPQILVFS